jgi:hypothetical protein
MEEIINNKYCFECEKRVGKKESREIKEKGEWIYYTEMFCMETYDFTYRSLDNISYYNCLECYSDIITWECKICNQEYDSTIEFCDEIGFRKCKNCIIEEVINVNMSCHCNVCRELFETYTIIPK